MKPKICFVYTTWPSQRAANEAAKKLLEERLIACANIIGPIASLYRWRNKVEHAKEIVVIFKTRERLYSRVQKRVQQLHSYECPCVVKIETPKAINKFAKWIGSETVG